MSLLFVIHFHDDFVVYQRCSRQPQEKSASATRTTDSFVRTSDLTRTFPGLLRTIYTHRLGTRTMWPIIVAEQRCMAILW